MAPSSGHLLVPKIMRILKFGISQTKAIIRSKLPGSTQTTGQYSLQPIRVYAQQPVHPLAYLKQSRSQNNRDFSTINRSSSAKITGPARNDRPKFPTSKASRAISQRGVAPFASTLRPNLTGGALPRSAGGYGLGGAGARHFSHTSGVQAQVVQNVNAGIRAFVIGGGKARFDGVHPFTGEKRFRAVGHTEDATHKQWEASSARNMRGTTLEFKLSPIIPTIIPALESALQEEAFGITLLKDSNLSNFARALNDLAAVRADLRCLSTLGDLPISCTTSRSGPIYSVRFPGCDADQVSRLCDEVGVRRGVIVEDEAWMTEKEVDMALLFPFAPAGGFEACSEYANDCDWFGEKPLNPEHQPEDLDWRHMLSPSMHTPPSAVESVYSFATMKSPSHQKAISTSDHYGSLGGSEIADEDPYYHTFSPLQTPTHSTAKSANADLEAIYSFLQVCEESRR